MNTSFHLEAEAIHTFLDEHGTDVRVMYDGDPDSVHVVGREWTDGSMTVGVDYDRDAPFEGSRLTYILREEDADGGIELRFMPDHHRSDSFPERELLEAASEIITELENV